MIGVDEQTRAALNTLSGHSSQLAESSFEISKAIAVCGLAIGFLFVFYSLANNKPRAREYTIAWIIALLLYLIYFEQ